MPLKLLVHAFACAVGATVPVIIMNANPLLCITNMILVIGACLTFEMCLT